MCGLDSIIPCAKFGWPYLGNATAATRAALPIPTSTSCSVFVTVSKQWCGRCSKLTRCLTSTETRRFIRDGEKGNGGVEVGGEGDYIPIATLSPPE